MVLIIMKSYGFKNFFYLILEVFVLSIELWFFVMRNKSIERIFY